MNKGTRNSLLGSLVFAGGLTALYSYVGIETVKRNLPEYAHLSMVDKIRLLDANDASLLCHDDYGDWRIQIPPEGAERDKAMRALARGQCLVIPNSLN